MTAALRFDHVTYHIDRDIAITDIDFTLNEGEIICLLGPSGCGKSTTLRLAAGLEKPDEGKIFISDRLVATPDWQLPPEKRQLGMVFQDYALFPHLSVIQNIGFGLRDLPDSESKRRSMLLMERLHIAHLQGHYPHTLSGGEMQRVALARAIAPSPRIVLLDEPFSELDPQLRADIRDDTLHLLKEVGAAAIMVTHDAEEAMFMADRIAVMKAGRIMQLDVPVQLYNKPSDPFSASFFGEINVFDGAVKNKSVMTPIGTVDARGFANEDPVHVVVRAESIGFPVAGGRGTNLGRGRVVASRLLGRCSLIHVSFIDAEKRPQHLHCRVPGVFLPAVGNELDIVVDLASALVFSAK